MHVKLKVLQGKLRKQSGRSLGGEVRVRRARFLIGSAEDCHMRCPSSSVSPHHCELLVEQQRVRVRDLQSETGTFVNGRSIEVEAELSSGDRLRIGRLEFVLVVEQTIPREVMDPVADYVSNLLVEADEEDRVRRLEDPEARQFQLDAVEAAGRREDAQSKPPQKLQRPAKKPPGKLPPPPKYVADNTVQAAEETLKKIFAPKK